MSKAHSPRRTALLGPFFAVSANTCIPQVLLCDARRLAAAQKEDALKRQKEIWDKLGLWGVVKSADQVK